MMEPNGSCGEEEETGLGLMERSGDGGPEIFERNRFRQVIDGTGAHDLDCILDGMAIPDHKEGRGF